MHEGVEGGRCGSSPTSLARALIACAGGFLAAVASSPALAQDSDGSEPPVAAPISRESSANPAAPPDQGAQANESADQPPETVARPTQWIRAAPLRLRYAEEPVGLPTIETLAESKVRLKETPEGLTPAESDEEGRLYTVAELCDGEARIFSLEAIDAICFEVFQTLRGSGLFGLLVSPDPYSDRIDLSTREVFESEDETLELIVWVAAVSEVRTLASGKRIEESERVNSPKHASILRKSPIKPISEDPARAYIRRAEIDDYVLRLSRHPGRRVDVAIAPTDERDRAVLDYLVAENRPISFYSQLSNTGTEDTDEWRERFGLSHTQFTGNDDILSLDYITAGFSEAHAFIGSYDTPVLDSERLRLRVYGNISSFEASDVGLASERFSGNSWTVGSELVYNLWQTRLSTGVQERPLFVDAFLGARWQHIEVVNEIAEVTGEDDVFLPRVGVRAESRNDVESLGASAAIEWSMPGVSGSDPEELEKLGRLDVDEQWVVFQFEGSYSFFLEPLINFGEWQKPRVPSDRGEAKRFDPGLSTLAHEVVLGVRTQWAFDHRLIPNAEQVVGGLYTVRGYPESVVAGDSVIVASAEYRFHLPRALAIQPEPSRLFGREFRMRPQQQYGRPDWDLVLRAFIDAGHVVNSDRLPFEKDESLVGAGIGAELLMYQNLSVRADWGFALDDVDNQNVRRGDDRLHVVFTLLF